MIFPPVSASGNDISSLRDVFRIAGGTAFIAGLFIALSGAGSTVDNDPARKQEAAVEKKMARDWTFGGLKIAGGGAAVVLAAETLGRRKKNTLPGPGSK